MRPLLDQLQVSGQTELVSANAPDVPRLTTRMRSGEEAAHREFYDLYYGRLLRYLLVVARGDEEAATEALEATLLRVVRHIKVFPDEAVLWSWLTVLARSSLADHRRKHGRYLTFLARFKRQAEVERSALGTSEDEGRLQTALLRATAALPAEERQILDWKYFEHRSVREIAAELRTSEKAIESRLVRIRKKLKEELVLQLRDE